MGIFARSQSSNDQDKSNKSNRQSKLVDFDDDKDKSNPSNWLKNKFRSALPNRLKHNEQLPQTTGTAGPSSHVLQSSLPTTPVHDNKQRHSSDFITMTLAQRLNELAAANAEGLLDDNEYRLLRQNLFERFAGGTSVPTEPSTIPYHPIQTSASTPEKSHHHTHPRTSPSKSRNFRRPSKSYDRPPSTRSNATSGSIASHLQNLVRKTSMSSIFNRNLPSPPHSPSRPHHAVNGDYEKDGNSMRGVSGRRSSSTFYSSQMPVITSGIATRGLAHRVSESSIKRRDKDRDRDGSDTRSLDSFKTSRSTHTTHTSRSIHAPSAFRIPQLGKTDNIIFNSDSSIYNDEGLGTDVKRIKEEVSNVEREMKGLMDAFAGLELSIVSKPPTINVSVSHGGSLMPSLKTSNGAGGRSPWASNISLVPEEQTNGSSTSVNTISRKDSSEYRVRPSNSSLSTSAHRKAQERPQIPAFPIGPKSGSQSDSSRNAHITISHSSGRASKKSPTGSTPMELPGSTSAANGSALKSLPSIPSMPSLPTSSTVSGTSFATSSLKRNGTVRSTMSNSSMSTSHLGVSASSSKNGGLGHAMLQGTSEDGTTELTDIRRRRAEIAQRYEAQLEFLRAKLKNAEMRERLTKS